ncbi:TerB family tellurite resistance protein [Salinisphaera hydrothermalis]|uniref:TerB family tellurite resistance protein n=1 Tax=Salinisphaera hydrothermalis TaxID=563188 RepID=UPI0033400315
MFLNRLPLAEKEAFIRLAHYVADVDDDFSPKEQHIIDKYCMEMQIDDTEYSRDSFDLVSVLSVFEEESHKRIVLLEIMALIFSDGDFHQSEEAVLNQIVEHFGLNPNLVIVYKEWARGILALYVQGEALVHL